MATEPTVTTTPLDALLPPAMAQRAESIGIAKLSTPGRSVLALSVLAGSFIALGGTGALIAATGATDLGFGVGRWFVGAVFSVGLVLVIVGGAELFTGNMLIVMAWANRRVSTARMLRNWGVVFAGNFVGAVATATLVLLAGVPELAGGEVGTTAIAVAHGKLGRGFVESLAAGVLCNALVCLAIWLTYSARTTVDRVVVIVPPIALFVAAGFEHSIANMFFVPFAWGIELSRDVAPSSISWLGFFRDHLLPVTLGNMIGGAGLVGLVYRFVYLRAAPPHDG